MSLTAMLHDWSLSMLLQIALLGAGVMMNARSFRVLTDASVKAHCR